MENIEKERLFWYIFCGVVLTEIILHSFAGFLLFVVIIAVMYGPKLFRRICNRRYDFLHPMPREYNLPAKEAFSKIREILADTSYHYGDKWHVSTADTQAGRIAADLRFTDEHIHYDMDGRGHLHPRRENLRRYLGVEILIQDTEKGTSTVQLDFIPKVEGYKFTACDSIVSGFMLTIDNALGSRYSECN